VVFNTYNNGATAGDINTGFDDRTFTTTARLGVLHNWLFRFNPNFSIELKTSSTNWVRSRT
jgi:hypothetical protein